MSPTDYDFYDFGPFRLDAREKTVSRDGVEVPLTPKLFDLLFVLVRNAGRTLEKGELLAVVWGDTFVEEGSVAKSLSRLRSALAPDGVDEAFIKTVSRRGYRLVVPVVPGRYTPAVPESRPAPAEGSEGPEPHQARPLAADIQLPLTEGISRGGGRSRRIAAVLGMVLIAAGSVWWAMRTVSSPPVNSLAVLPFRVLTPATLDADFGVGLSDAIITRLAQAQDLKVRPTSAIMRYEHGNIDAAEVTRTLGVDALVEGTIREASGRVRVSAQLVGPDGQPRWAGQFDEARADLFALESAIANRVAEVLALKMRPPSSPAGGTVNGAAYEAYLRGRSLIVRLTPDTLQRGIEYLNRAVTLDPRYASPFSALALAHINTVDLAATPSEAFPKARVAAERALALDPSLADAHAMLGTVAMQFDWDWKAAERHFQRALDLDPNQSFAQVYYGWLLALTGRLDESRVHVDMARAIDPLSRDVAVTSSLVPYYERQSPAALARTRESVELFPDFWLAHVLLGRALEQSGDLEVAIVEFEMARGLEGGEPEALMDLGRAYARAGRVSDARAVLERFDEIAKVKPVAPFQRAMVHIGLGEPAEAFRLLNEAVDQRSWYVSWLKMDPMLDPLRDDARYGVLLARAGFAVNALTSAP
jgi:DNA-binding winged helix-turn-helix (wHTH) protein/TolB-like protein/Flp pilus assembly protein TadD